MLRQIFEFGTSYRIPEPISWNDVKLTCLDALNNLMEKICKKFKLLLQDLQTCLTRCMSIIDSRINFQRQSNNSKASVEIGRKQWNCLNELKKR